MKILIVCQHWPMCLGRRLLKPFERLGIDARHIGADKGTDSGHGVVDARYVWPSQGNWDHSWSDWTPDIVLYAETLHTSWRHQVYADVPHVHYNSAGPMIAPMPGMDWTFTATSWGGIWNRTNRVTWIPCAYDADMCSPSTIPWEDRAYDVCLIGRLDAARQQLLEKLTQAHVKVFSATGLVYQEYAEAYQNSRMGLVQTVQQTVPIRTFETPALGCLMVSPWYPEYPYLRVRGMLTFHETNPDMLLSVVRFALAHPEKSKHLIEVGLQWVQNHSWDHRAVDMLAVFEQLRTNQ